MHSQYFLYPSMIQNKKRCVFPSQRINTNCTAGGRGGWEWGSFQPWKNPSQVFNPHKSLQGRLTPHNHGGAHVCFTCRVSIRHRTHTFQHIEQAHTGLPASPNSAREGAQGGGRPAHQAPSSPAPPSKHKGEVASVGPHRKKCKTFCGAGQPRTPRVFKHQRKELLVGRLPVLCHHWNHLLFSTHRQGAPVSPTCSPESARAT